MQDSSGGRRVPGHRMGAPAAYTDWFTRSPYPGVWGLAALFLLLFTMGLLFARVRRAELPRAASVRVVSAPSVAPAAPEQLPVVKIRTLAARRENPARPAPSATGPLLDNRAPAPSVLPPVTAPAPPPGDLPADRTPAPIPAERGPDADAPDEPGRDEPRTFPPAEEPRPAPAPRVEPPRREPDRPAPRRETGRMSIYFDADSTTFDRRDERLPMRVEVYVDGVKRVDASDPEKRGFNVGQLSEGLHEIRIVPYVGGLPADPRREVVRIRRGEKSRFKAVLRRSDGMSRIGKFEERD